MKKTAILLSVSLLSVTLKAQDTAKASAPEPAKSPFTFSGYVDSYYMQNLNNPKSGINLGQSGTERAFDQRSNTIGIGLVQTKFGYSNKKSDVVIDLTFGPNADMGNYGNNPFLSWNSHTVASATGTPGAPAYFLGGIAIKQAYFNYKATDKLTFTAGQFGTHIGTEVIDAPINYNYSLSNLFNNGPFYHIGVKANYAFSDKFALMAGLVNNVDALYDNNRAKGLIAQMFINPAKGWNVYINYIGSNEANSTTAPGDTLYHKTTGLYQLIDLTTGYQITDKFYMGLNAAYGSQRGDYQGNGIPSVNAAATKDSTKHWGGAALYMNYAFTGMFGLGLRAEHFDNSSGVRSLRNNAAQAYNIAQGTGSTTGGTSVTSLTLTGIITLAEGHLLLKPEVRMDMYNKNAYTGAASGDIQQFQDSKGYFTKTSQTTIGLAAIYKF